VVLSEGPGAVGGVSLLAVDAGYLIGIVPWGGQGLYGGSFWTLAADGGALMDAGTSLLPAASLSFAPAYGSNPITLIAATYDSRNQDFDEAVCLAPYDDGVDAGSPLQFGGQINLVRAARAADGTLGAVFVDVDPEDPFYGTVEWAIGPPNGGCPSSLTELPDLDPSVIGLPAANDSAIFPSGPAGQFTVAASYSNPSGPDVLALFAIPSGAQLSATSIGSQGAPHVVAVANDAGFSLLVTDTSLGVAVYTYDAGALSQRATVSNQVAQGVSATSCGDDCLATAWLEIAGPVDDGIQTLAPRYAVVNREGCGRVVSLGGGATVTAVDGEAVPVALADGAGGVLVVYAVNAGTLAGGTTTLYGVFCAP